MMAPVAERVTAPDDSSHAIVSSVQTDLYMPESAGTVFLTTTMYIYTHIYKYAEMFYTCSKVRFSILL